MSNQQVSHRGTYAEIRATYKLPAQMACNVPRQVGATYKSLWTKVMQKHAARKADRARKRYKGLDEAPRYVTPAFSYNYQRDHSFETEQRVSILTLAGRVIVPYTGNNLHVGLIQHGAQIGAAKL